MSFWIPFHSDELIDLYLKASACSASEVCRKLWRKFLKAIHIYYTIKTQKVKEKNAYIIKIVEFEWFLMLVIVQNNKKLINKKYNRIT